MHIDELNEKYIISSSMDFKNNPNLRNFEILDFDKLNYIKDFIPLEDDKYYKTKDGSFYIKKHNSFIKTFQKTHNYVSILLYEANDINFNDKFHQELYIDLQRYTSK